jgi:magnesium transporter
MVTRSVYKDITWIDLESPTREEVREIMEEFHVDPLAADELLSPTLRPKVDLYENLIYLIVHFPLVVHTHGRSGAQEIDFIIGKNFIITTHYELVDPLHEFSRVFEVNSILDKSNIGTHAGFVFFYILRELYRNVMLQLDELDRKLEDIEERIFKGEEAFMVREISKVNRDLLNVRQAIRPHKEILESFEIAATRFFGDDFLYHVRAISGEYYRVYNVLESQKETLVDLRETNDALLTTKTNEIMKILTVMAFVILPPGLIAGLFGMNVKPPFLDTENHFWLIVVVMMSSMIFTFVLMKWKKWI